MKMLRQKGSGHLYAWTEALAKRDDMVEVETAQPAPKPTPPVQAASVTTTDGLVQTTTGPTDDVVSVGDRITIRMNDGIHQTGTA